MRKLESKYYILCVLLFFFLLTGCKVKRPKGVIPESKMEELLYDYHVAKAMGENLPYNENYKKALYMEYVFKKHETTEAVFDSSMVWYTRHADILSKIYEKVTKRLKTEQDGINHLIAIRENKHSISTPGDSIDLWLLGKMISLTNRPLNNKIIFTLLADSNFKARDTLQWEVEYKFMNDRPDSTEAVFMAMMVQFTNDSIISGMKKVLESGLHSIRLQADTLGDIKEIKGFIHYLSNNDTLKHLLADRISLTRYHSKDTLFAAKDSLINKESAELPSDTIKEENKPEEIISKPERQNPEDFRQRRRPAQRELQEEQPEKKLRE